MLIGDLSYSCEIDEYLSDAREDCNPLEYWKKHMPLYPKLATLARKYLSIPANLGSAGRLFSIAGSIARAKRARICLKMPEILSYTGNVFNDETLRQSYLSPYWLLLLYVK